MYLFIFFMCAQSCPTLCNPMVAHQTPAVYGISQERKLELVKIGVGCRFLLQGVFLTQGLNLCLLHWQADSTSTATWEVPVYFKTQKFASRVTVIFYFLIKKVYFALTLGRVPLVDCVWSWSASSSLPGTTHHCLSFLCFIYALGTTPPGLLQCCILTPILWYHLGVPTPLELH